MCARASCALDQNCPVPLCLMQITAIVWHRLFWQSSPLCPSETKTEERTDSPPCAGPFLHQGRGQDWPRVGSRGEPSERPLQRPEPGGAQLFAAPPSSEAPLLSRLNTFKHVNRRTLWTHYICLVFTEIKSMKNKRNNFAHQKGNSLLTDKQTQRLSKGRWVES